MWQMKKMARTRVNKVVISDCWTLEPVPGEECIGEEAQRVTDEEDGQDPGEQWCS